MNTAADDRTALVALRRRLGFGFGPGELDEAMARGAAAELDRLLDPDAAGIAADPDPWTAVPAGDVDQRAKVMREQVVAPWLGLMATTARPLHEWMRWYWSGHLVVDARDVKEPIIVANYLRTLGTGVSGSYRALLGAITIDPAMLLYLDGDRSTAAGPNENFSRELLELFALSPSAGYTENDVRNGAVALAGWVVARKRAIARFVEGNHSGQPVEYLGTSVVSTDEVLDVVCAHRACARHVVNRVTAAVFGADFTDQARAEIAGAFESSGLDIGALVRAVAERVVAGELGGPIVLAPVPWAVQSARATGASVAWPKLLKSLADAGQAPLQPPNVGGWPAGSAWFASATVVGRIGVATVIADSLADDAPILAVTAAADADELGVALGLPGAVSATTMSAVTSVADPRGRLAVLLTSPEMVLA